MPLSHDVAHSAFILRILSPFSFLLTSSYKRKALFCSAPRHPMSHSAEKFSQRKRQTESERESPSKSLIMGDKNQESFDSPNTEEQPKDSVEPTDLFSLIRLKSFNSSPSTTTSGCDHLPHHPPCTSCGCFGTNPMKRRSCSSDYCFQGPSMAAPEPKAKKFCEQEDSALRGFSAISLPLEVGSFAPANAKPRPALRRCISDPYKPPASIGTGFPTNSFHSPEHVKTASVASPVTPSSVEGSTLPPLPPSLQRCVSDPTPSPAKGLSRSSSLVERSLEETPNSTRMRRMKERLREMRQWWDEVMREDKEDSDEGAEDDKVLEKGDSEEDSEEAVNVEWAEKCLSINFNCPCGRGYKILLSGSNCYYKLV